MHKGTYGDYMYVFYAEDGKSPVNNFIFARGEKEKGKIAYYLELLMQRGPSLAGPYAKKMTGSIYELRPSFWNTEIRLLYFWDGNTAVFVGGFVKKGQKTPRNELIKAEDRMKRYFAAKNPR